MKRFTGPKALHAVAPAGITLAFGNVIAAALQHGLGWTIEPNVALSFGIVAMFFVGRFMGGTGEEEA